MLVNKFSSRTLADLLAEFVDHLRAVFSIGNPRPEPQEQLIQNAQTRVSKTKSAAHEKIEALAANDPEIWFIKMVEDCLRKFPDSIALGQSPLTAYVGIVDESQIARGKQLQQLLREAIESLRPARSRPVGALPRDWYNYVVLHDAYVKGVRNCEVMARLYISEGTFHRTRRNAVRGVANWLFETAK